MKGTEEDGQRVPGGAGCRAYMYYLPPAAPGTTTLDSGPQAQMSQSGLSSLAGDEGRGWINQWPPLPARPREM